MDERKTNVEVFAQLSFHNTDFDFRVDATFKGEEQLFLFYVFKYHLPRFGTVFFLVLIYFLLK